MHRLRRCHTRAERLLTTVVQQYCHLHTFNSSNSTRTSSTRSTLTKKKLSADVLRRSLASHLATQDAAGAVAAARDAFFNTEHDAHFSWEALSTTLFACERQGEQALGLALVADVRRHMPDLAWSEASESALAVVLRMYCAVGDADSATHMVSYLISSGLLRARTASTYMQFICDPQRHNAAASQHSSGRARELAFALYQECKQRGIELGHDDYCSLGKLCVAHREPLHVLHALLTDMREHIAEVSPEFVTDAVLAPWCAQSSGGGGAVQLTEVSIPPPPPPPPVAHVAASASASASAADADKKGEDTTSRSDPDEALPPRCPSCSHPLRGYPFTAQYRAALLKDLQDVVIPTKCRTARAMQGFRTWQRYIASRAASDPVDVLVDGANVGYYGLSSWYHIAKRDLLLTRRGVDAASITPEDVCFNTNCKRAGVDVAVNFELIDKALQACVRELGFKRPLVLLHERHGEAKNLTPQQSALLQAWQQRQWVYFTPSGLNDDLCWLYAALELTPPTEEGKGKETGSRSDHLDHVGGGGGAQQQQQQQQQGTGVFVLTNDLMRDHHFSLLSPRYFSWWRDSHTIKFVCERVDNETCVRLRRPTPFIRCIQTSTGRVGPGPGRCASSWHIPVAGEDQSRWVCMSG